MTIPGATPQALFEQFVSDLRAMIADLPIDSAGVREVRRLVEQVRDDRFWYGLDARKYDVLALEVAPLMRYLPAVSLAEATFQIHCLDAIAALLDGDTDRATAAARLIREDIIRLPVDHPDVEPRAALVREHWDEAWPALVDLERVERVRGLADVMSLRQTDPTHVITIDLADAFAEQRWVEVGPDATPIDITEYQAAVVERIEHLASEDPAFRSLRQGEVVSDADLDRGRLLLAEPDLFVTEDALRRAWRAPHATWLEIVRHVLGVEPLQSREDAIQAAFASFIASKSYLRSEQLTFVRLVARRLVDAGTLSRADLYDHPFTALTTDPEALFLADDLDDMIAIAVTLGAPASA